MTEQGPAPGWIWTLSAGDFDELTFALVLWGNESETHVVPLSPELSPLHTDYEIESDVLGFALWARCSEKLEVLVEQLVEPLGSLPDADTDFIRSGVAAIEQCVDLDPEFLGRSGPSPLSEADVRLAELDRWRDDHRRLAEPHRALLEPTLAAVIRSQRERLALPIEAAAQAADVDPATLKKLESATLDLHAELAVAGLKKLVSTLRLPPSRRLRELVSQAVAAAEAPADYGNRTAFARRRSGTRRGSGGIPRGPELGDAYAEKLDKMLPPWPS